MRVSPKRHPLAVLRLTIGLTQKEMAELAGCSRATIQDIELCKGLQLSDRLALTIAAATGIDLTWLITGDTSAPPVTCLGEPFDKATYKNWRASINHPTQGLDAFFVDTFIRESVKNFLAMYLSSLFEDRHKQFENKFALTLNKLSSEFPADEEFLTLRDTEFKKLKAEPPFKRCAGEISISLELFEFLFVHFLYQSKREPFTTGLGETHRKYKRKRRTSTK